MGFDPLMVMRFKGCNPEIIHGVSGEKATLLNAMTGLAFPRPDNAAQGWLVSGAGAGYG
jgi:hypothetical protein